MKRVNLFEFLQIEFLITFFSSHPFKKPLMESTLFCFRRLGIAAKDIRRLVGVLHQIIFNSPIPWGILSESVFNLFPAFMLADLPLEKLWASSETVIQSILKTNFFIWQLHILQCAVNSHYRC